MFIGTVYMTKLCFTRNWLRVGFGLFWKLFQNMNITCFIWSFFIFVKQGIMCVPTSRIIFLGTLIWSTNDLKKQIVSVDWQTFFLIKTIMQTVICYFTKYTTWRKLWLSFSSSKVNIFVWRFWREWVFRCQTAFFNKF